MKKVITVKQNWLYHYRSMEVLDTQNNFLDITLKVKLCHLLA